MSEALKRRLLNFGSMILTLPWVSGYRCSCACGCLLYKDYKGPCCMCKGGLHEVNG